MIRVPKEVHRALGTLLKYKLINEQDMSVFIEKYMKKDASLRVVQLVQPRDATVDLKRKALDTITSKATMALTFAETLELLTKNHGTAHTENALRYVMNLLVQEGKLEQTNVDGRVLYARKDR